MNQACISFNVANKRTKRNSPDWVPLFTGNFLWFLFISS